MSSFATFLTKISNHSSFSLSWIWGTPRLRRWVLRVKTHSMLRIQLMRPDTNFPRKKKQPDKSFIPWPRPNPTNPLGNLIQLQPIFGVPWPTIVLEVGNSEAVSKLIEHCNKCLGYTTQVNVFVGISYNRNTTRQTDSWWMCVAHRDTNAPQPPPGTPPEYPAPIIVGEF